MKKMVLVGLTGQTGAGKTTVCEILKKRGFAVIDADRAARTVTECGHPCLKALTAVFGTTVLLPDGSLDRKAVASMIFGDPVVKEKYEAVIFPYITQQIRKEIRELQRAGAQIVILDAPTLFESGLHRFCRTVVSVVAEPEIRFRRIVERDHLTEEQAKLRMQAQYPESFFRAHSDFVIENNGHSEQLNNAVSEAAEYLLRTAETVL